MQSTRIPEPLEPQYHFLLWDSQSFSVAIIAVFVGALCKQFTLGCVAGVAAMVVWSRAKASKPDGWLHHYAYWHGLMGRMKRTPDPALRRFLG